MGHRSLVTAPHNEVSSSDKNCVLLYKKRVEVSMNKKGSYIQAHNILNDAVLVVYI